MQPYDVGFILLNTMIWCMVKYFIYMLILIKIKKKKGFEFVCGLIC